MRLSSLLVASLFERLRATERRGGGPGPQGLSPPPPPPLIMPSSGGAPFSKGGGGERLETGFFRPPSARRACSLTFFANPTHKCAQKKKSLRHGAMRLFVAGGGGGGQTISFDASLMAAIPSPVQKKGCLHFFRGSTHVFGAPPYFLQGGGGGGPST